jgi:hypothetical protein
VQSNTICIWLPGFEIHARSSTLWISTLTLAHLLPVVSHLPTRHSPSVCHRPSAPATAPLRVAASRAPAASSSCVVASPPHTLRPWPHTPIAHIVTTTAPAAAPCVVTGASATSIMPTRPHAPSGWLVSQGRRLRKLDVQMLNLV